MNQINFALIALALIGYFVAASFYMSSLALRSRNMGNWGMRTLIVVFAVHTLSLAARWMDSGRLPLVDLFEALSFYSWLTILIYFVIERAFGYKAIGAIVTTVAFVSVALAAAVRKDTVPLAPVLESGWFPIHVAVSFLAYTVFTVAFGIATVYLLQERQLKARKPQSVFNKLPPLETMERMGHKAIGVGFPFMTLAIATGAVWAEQAWGSYWSWEPKQTMALVTWLVYVAYFHLRDVVGWRGKRSAWLIVAGFISVIFTFLGAEFFNSGAHNFI